MKINDSPNWQDIPDADVDTGVVSVECIIGHLVMFKT